MPRYRDAYRGCGHLAQALATMDSYAYNELSSQIADLKSWLIVVLVAVGVMAILFAAVLRAFAKAARVGHINAEARAFQVQASALSINARIQR